MLPLALSETKLANLSDPAHPKLKIIMTLPSVSLYCIAYISMNEIFNVNELVPARIIGMNLFLSNSGNHFIVMD